MRYMKWVVLFPVAIVALVTALPAFADDPFGGPPSSSSGNGSTTWSAIYIGNDGCWTGALAAGSNMWFKADTWPVNLDGVPVTLLVWLDDELPGAIRPSGAAVLGPAYNYFVGTADDFDSANRLGDQQASFVNGFAFRVFDPDALAPNYYYAAPNMWILTTANGAAPKGNVQSEGWGTHNSQGEPNHLLWYEGGSWSGWVYIQAYNQMLESGTFSICTQKHLRFDRYITPTPTDPAASTGLGAESVLTTTSRLLQAIPGATATPLASPAELGANRALLPLLAPLTPAAPTAAATAPSPDEASPSPPAVGPQSPTPAASDSPAASTPAPTLEAAPTEAQSQTDVTESTPAPTTGAATSSDDAGPTQVAPADAGAAPATDAPKPADDTPQPGPSAPAPSDALPTQAPPLPPTQAPPPATRVPPPTPTAISNAK
ncbi:MAG: hypothetical protein M1482_15885 [Chloroflexi bacterium]|nr:hypothetical protein [Chloroflexota bacterium]